MIRPFSIALLYGGEKAKSYAKIMQHIINEYAQYYPLIPVIVESTTISQRLNDYNHNIIFEMLDECDFAYFFLTSSYVGYEVDSEKKEERKLCRPNPILEYGYMLKKLGAKKIKVIRDFSYDLIEKGTFVFPSDLAGLNTSGFINEQEKSIDEMLRSIFQNDLSALGLNQEYNHMDAEKLIFSCNHYDVDFGNIFLEDINNQINEYALDKQHLYVWDRWNDKKNRLAQISGNSKEKIIKEIYFNYEMMFCYERILFFMLFKDNVTNINSFKCDIYPYTIEDADKCLIVNLYNEIYDYVVNMNNAMAPFFREKISELETYLNSLPVSTNPLIVAIAKNYLGLSYLNTYLKIDNEAKLNNMNLLKKAELNFTEVIDMCKNSGPLKDVQQVLPAFVYYNRARVRQNLKINEQECLSDYSRAIHLRKGIANNSKFPEFMQIYFLKETYHAINSKINFQMQIWNKIDNSKEIERALKETELIQDELKRYERLYIGNRDFFYTIKSNAIKNQNKLEELLS